MHAALVEIGDLCSQVLQGWLERLGEQTGLSVTWELFGDGESFLEKYDSGWDLVLMGIDGGLQRARRLRELDSRVGLILVSLSDRYALAGYDLRALDYIVMPSEYETFAGKLQGAMAELRLRRDKRICIETEGAHKWLPCEEVYYIEVFDHLLVYHTKEGVLRAKGSIGALSEELEDWGFFRCNRYCLVNLRFVTGLTEGEAEAGSFRVPVSRRRRKLLAEAMERYCGSV